MTDERPPGPGAANPSPRPSPEQAQARKDLRELFEQSPIPAELLLDNLELYMRPTRVSQMLALQQLYLKIVDVHGIVVEFGVRWGKNLALFTALRTIYEPLNLYRRIVGFDTFEGLRGISAKDGTSPVLHEGAMSVPAGYETYLEEVLSAHEREAPVAHIRRYEIRRGDAPDELERFLDEYPDTVVALAYFDLDLYEPTKACLELLLPHTTKGTVIAFDEFLHPDYPGEGRAAKDVLDLTQRALQHVSIYRHPSFVVL